MESPFKGVSASTGHPDEMRFMPPQYPVAADGVQRDVPEKHLLSRDPKNWSRLRLWAKKAGEKKDPPLPGNFARRDEQGGWEEEIISGEL
jgi:hypothetical protein